MMWSATFYPSAAMVICGIGPTFGTSMFLIGYKAWASFAESFFDAQKPRPNVDDRAEALRRQLSGRRSLLPWTHQGEVSSDENNDIPPALAIDRSPCLFAETPGRPEQQRRRDEQNAETERKVVQDRPGYPSGHCCAALSGLRAALRAVPETTPTEDPTLPSCEGQE